MTAAAETGLPADGHVHSEWSWDAPDGSMERTCARAVDIGLPVVAFTEHADFTAWTATTSDLDERLRSLVTPAGSLAPPELDLNGYLECVQRCRDKFPGLRILTGVELGEPHWHSGVATKLCDAGHFDRVLGSLPSLPVGPRFCEPAELYKQRSPAEVVREYLAELHHLVTSSDLFALAKTGGQRHQVSHRLFRFHSWCSDSKLPELERLPGTIDAWWPEVLAFLRTGVTNAGTGGHEPDREDRRPNRLRLLQPRQPTTTSTLRLHAATPPGHRHQRVNFPLSSKSHFTVAGAPGLLPGR